MEGSSDPIDLSHTFTSYGREGANAGGGFIVTQRELLRDRALRDYLANVLDWHGYIRFLGLPDRRDNPDMVIDRLFIDPLLTPRHVSPDEGPEVWMSQAQTAFEALSVGSPLVVLGDPGAGKSTLADFLVSLLAQPGASPLVERFGWRLPIPMVLRELRLQGVGDFDGLIGAFLNHAMSEPLRSHSYVGRALKEGRAFLLLDGIDEIGDSAAREDLRNAVYDGFDRYPNCLWMLTSRIVGYSEMPFDSYEPDGPASVARSNKRSNVRRSIVTRFIAPFDDRRINAFAQRWYAQRESGRARAQNQARDLVRVIHQDQAILRLARVPNLLTMMALIHRVEATLPHGRALLYDRISEAYLELIDKFRGIRSGAIDLPHKRRWLARVGYEMQLRRNQKQGAFESEILVDSADVIRWLNDEMERGGRASALASPQQFLDYVGRRSGLFLPRGHGRYAFIHLTFQEYFAAAALEREVTGMNWALRKPTPLGIDRSLMSAWARTSVWRETLVFLFELLSPKREWHDELQISIFGPHFSFLQKRVQPTQPPSLALLLARLIVNPQSGIDPANERVAITACVRTELSRDFDSRFDLSTRLFSMLLSQDPSRNSDVMEIIGRQVRALRATSVSLRSTRVTDQDLSLLRDLASLARLDLMETSVSDISPVGRLTSLKEIDLMNTSVADISPLGKLSLLETIDLSETPVSSVVPLSGLRNLRQLDLMRSSVAEISAISRCATLTSVNLRDTQVFDITPLANLRSLESLNLMDTKVSTIAPLSGVTALQDLDLMNTHVSDIRPLRHLGSLRRLDLRGTRVSDVNALRSVRSLVWLDLMDTFVSDIDSLSDLVLLQRLDLMQTLVVDVSALRSLTSLTWLDLSLTGVADLAPLERLSSLSRLDLMGSKVIDVSPLRSLGSLVWLDLSDTQVSDLRPLADLRSLEQLFVSESVSGSTIQMLSEALPECRISRIPDGYSETFRRSTD